MPPPLGVSAACLREFLARVPQDFSTDNVCEKIVKPETVGGKLYIDLLKGKKDEDGVPFVGHATVFVSHAWAYPFHVTCDVMLSHATEVQRKESPAYFWLDVLVNDQNGGTHIKPHDWWSTTFKDSIRSIGSVLLVLYPWSNPVPLTRAWCLWEILCSIDLNVQFHVRLPASEESVFIDALAEDYGIVMEALVKVQAEKATSKNLGDKRMIFAAIEQSKGGFPALNQRVKDQLRAWLLRMAQDSVLLLEKQGEVDSDRFINLTFNVAAVLNNHAYYQDAFELYSKNLKARLAQSKGEHTEGIGKTYCNMGISSFSLDRYDEALELYAKSLEIMRSLGKEDTEAAAITHNSIGFTMMSMGNFATAVLNFERSAAILVKELGESHETTAACFGNLGIAYRNLGDYPKALEYYHRCLEVQKEKLGANHPSVGNSIMNIGSAYMFQGNYTEAIEYYKQSIAIKSGTIGDEHRDTAFARGSLGLCLLKLGKREEAIKCFRTTCGVLRRTIGPEHHHTKYYEGLLADAMKTDESLSQKEG